MTDPLIARVVELQRDRRRDQLAAMLPRRPFVCRECGRGFRSEAGRATHGVYLHPWGVVELENRKMGS